MKNSERDVKHGMLLATWPEINAAVHNLSDRSAHRILVGVTAYLAGGSKGFTNDDQVIRAAYVYAFNAIGRRIEMDQN